VNDIVVGRRRKIGVKKRCGKGRDEGRGGSETSLVGFRDGGRKLVKTAMRGSRWRLRVVVVIGENVDFGRLGGGNVQVGKDIADGGLDEGIAGGAVGVGRVMVRFCIAMKES